MFLKNISSMASFHLPYMFLILTYLYLYMHNYIRLEYNENYKSYPNLMLSTTELHLRSVLVWNIGCKIMLSQLLYIIVYFFFCNNFISSFIPFQFWVFSELIDIAPFILNIARVSFQFQFLDKKQVTVIINQFCFELKGLIWMRQC